MDLDKLQIKITGRISHFLNIVGEHLSSSNIKEAINIVNQEHSLNIENFTVAPVITDTKKSHHWFIDSNSNWELEEIMEVIDEKLKELNDDYKVVCEAILAKPKLTVIDKNSFFKWLELNGILNGQAKFPMVLSDKAYEDWSRFLETEKINS